MKKILNIIFLAGICASFSAVPMTRRRAIRAQDEENDVKTNSDGECGLLRLPVREHLSQHCALQRAYGIQ